MEGGGRAGPSPERPARLRGAAGGGTGAPRVPLGLRVGGGRENAFVARPGQADVASPVRPAGSAALTLVLAVVASVWGWVGKAGGKKSHTCSIWGSPLTVLRVLWFEGSEVVLCSLVGRFAGPRRVYI